MAFYSQVGNQASLPMRWEQIPLAEDRFAQNRRNILVQESACLWDELESAIELQVSEGFKHFLAEVAIFQTLARAIAKASPVLTTASSGYGSISEGDLIDLNEGGSVFSGVSETPPTTPSYWSGSSSGSSYSAVVRSTPSFFGSVIQMQEPVIEFKSPMEMCDSAWLKSKSNNSPCSDPRRLYITNIPFRFVDTHLKALCGRYGRVTKAEVIFNDKGSKGFGFVTMGSVQEAQAVIRYLDNVCVEGRVVGVNWATRKKPIGKSSHLAATDALFLLEN